MIELHFGIVHLVDHNTIVLHVQTGSHQQEVAVKSYRKLFELSTMFTAHATFPKHRLEKKSIISLDRVVLVKELTETPDELRPTLQTRSYMLQSKLL
jgi:hypothetical protein